MELSQLMQFVFSLILVIGLIWLTAYLMKRFGVDKRLRGVTGQQGRLAVADVLYLDPRRKLMIVRADAQEYLLLVSNEKTEILDRLEGKRP